MKGRKGAFANTTTGYGKQKQTSFNRSSAKNERESSTKHDVKPTELAKTKSGSDDAKAESEKDLNSGFGDYLRTTEAFEMMKLFVFANTIMLIVTMAWPHIREQFFMLNQWLESFKNE